MNTCKTCHRPLPSNERTCYGGSVCEDCYVAREVKLPQRQFEANVTHALLSGARKERRQ